MIIDLSNVAIANQYKNQFDQELNVDHVGVKGSLPKNFRSFDALEKSLKKKFKEYCEQMSVIKQEKQIWYQGGADISGEYDTKETESEKGNFIYQCRSCTKLRKIPRIEITASSNKTLQLEKDKGIWVSRKNPNLTCATLGLVEASHDLCMELMDVFLSAEIGHGSLCKDETCKLCKPENMSLKKKREPKYFLEKNTRKFDDKLTESKKKKEIRNKISLGQYQADIVKREEEIAFDLDNLENGRKKTKRKPRKRAQATFTDALLNKSARDLTDKSILNQHAKNVTTSSSRSRKTNINPVNVDQTETGSVNFNTTIGSINHQINPLNESAESIAYPRIPSVPTVVDLELDDNEPPTKKRNTNIEVPSVDLTGETDSEDERRMNSQREQISQRMTGVKKEAEEIVDKASTVDTPVWGMQGIDQLENSRESAPAGDAAGSAGAKNESFESDVVDQILNPENNEPENDEPQNNESENVELDHNNPENENPEQNNAENIELEIDDTEDLDPKTIAQQLLPHFKPVNREQGNFENMPGSPDNSIPTTNVLETNLEESHSKTSQSLSQPDPIAAEAISKIMIEQDERMRNTITWGRHETGYVAVVRAAIVEHGGDSWSEEQQLQFFMKYTMEQAKTHVIPFLFPKQKNENTQEDSDE